MNQEVEGLFPSDNHATLSECLREAARQAPDEWGGMAIWAGQLDKGISDYFCEQTVISALEFTMIYLNAMEVWKSLTHDTERCRDPDVLALEFALKREAIVAFHRPMPEGSRLQ